MKENDFEAALTQCLHVIHRAFDEADRKGAMTKAVVIDRLNLHIHQLDKIRREHISRAEELWKQKQLQQEIASHVHEVHEQTGTIPSQKEVERHIHESALLTKLISQQPLVLRDRGVASVTRLIIANEAAKKEPLPEDEKQKQKQMRLAFFEVPEFRDAQHIKVKWLDKTGNAHSSSIDETTEANRLLAMAQCLADYDLLRAAHEKLHPAVISKGDGKAYEIWAEYIKDQQKQQSRRNA